MDKDDRKSGADLLRKARLKRLYAKKIKSRPSENVAKGPTIFPQGREEAFLSPSEPADVESTETLVQEFVPSDEQKTESIPERIKENPDQENTRISGFQLESLCRQIAGGLSLSAINDELLGAILISEEFKEEVTHFLNLYLSHCSKNKRLKVISFMLYERFDLLIELHDKVVELALVDLASSTEFTKAIPTFFESLYDFDVAKMSYHENRRKFDSSVFHWFAVQSYLFKGDYKSSYLVLNLFGKDILESIGKPPFDIDFNEFLLLSGRVCILAEEYKQAESFLKKIGPRSKQYRVAAQLLDSLGARLRKAPDSQVDEGFTNLPESLKYAWIEERLAGFPGLEEKEKLEVKKVALTLDQHFPSTIYWKAKLAKLLISAMHLHQSDFGFLSSWLQARAIEQAQGNERLAVWSEVKRFGQEIFSDRKRRYPHASGGVDMKSPLRSDYRYWVFVSHFQCFLGGGLDGVSDLETAYLLSRRFNLSEEFKILSEHAISFLDYFCDFSDDEAGFLKTMVYLLNPSHSRHATKSMVEKWLIRCPAKPVVVLEKIKQKYAEWQDTFGQVECLRSTAMSVRLTNQQLRELSVLWHKEGSNDTFWIAMTIAKHRQTISKSQEEMWKISGENKSLPGLSTERMELALKVAGRCDSLPLDALKCLFQLMGPMANGLSDVAGYKKVKNKKLSGNISKAMKDHLEKVMDSLSFDGGVHFVSQISDHPFNQDRLPIVSTVGRGEWNEFLKALYCLSSGDLLVEADGCRAVKSFMHSVRKSLGKAESVRGDVKWYSRLGERHKAQFQKVSRYFQDHDCELIKLHYTLFLTRLAILLFPKHLDALSFAAANTSNVAVLQHVEHFLLSDQYAKYRKLTGLQNKSPSFIN